MKFESRRYNLLPMQVLFSSPLGHGDQQPCVKSTTRYPVGLRHLFRANNTGQNNGNDLMPTEYLLRCFRIGLPLSNFVKRGIFPAILFKIVARSVALVFFQVLKAMNRHLHPYNKSPFAGLYLIPQSHLSIRR